MTKVIKTGWAYCDKKTGQPTESRHAGFYIMINKPTPEQIASYNRYHDSKAIARRVVITSYSEQGPVDGEK